LFFCSASVTVFAHRAGEYIVSQFDAWCAVAVLEPDQPRADQTVAFLFGDMRGDRVLADIAIAEPLLGDQLGLDESRNFGAQIADARRAVVRQRVAFGVFDQSVVELRESAPLAFLIELTTEQAEQRGFH